MQGGSWLGGGWVGGGLFKFSGALMCLCPAESKEIENVAAVWRGANKEMERSMVNKRECERGM